MNAAPLRLRKATGDVNCTLGTVLTLTAALITPLAPMDAALDRLEACLS